MDGGGDNQLTVYYNERPVNRRLQMLRQDFGLLNREHAIRPAYHVRRHIHIHGPSYNWLTGDIIRTPHLDAIPLAIREDDENDSGFESGSESDVF